MDQVALCPTCQRKLLVPDELQGKSVRCPSCETVFIAEVHASQDPGPGLPEEESARSENVRTEPERSPRDQEDRESPRRFREEKDDDYYDGPEYGSGYRRSSRQAALRAVSPPAAALQVVSGISIAFNILFLLLVAVGVAMPLAAGGPGPNNQADQVGMAVQVISGFGGRIFALVLCILIAIGATKMKRLESRSWAMAASIMAITPCTGCCILTMPFGIWALVVISKPDVKDHFG